MTNPLLRPNTMALIAGFLSGVFVFWLNPYGAAMGSDFYIKMAMEAREYGLFGISESWWAPGFPWLLALASKLTFNSDLITTGTILAAGCVGLIVYLYVRQAFDFFPSTQKSIYAIVITLLLSTAILKASLRSLAITQLTTSEVTFWAATTLALFFLAQWRKQAGPLWFWGLSAFLFVVAWTIRFAGIIAAPILFIPLLPIFLRNRSQAIMTLKKSWLPILASVSLIVFTIAFYKIRFGIWIRSSHPGPGPTLLRNLEDYFSVIFGYIFDLPGHYLQTPVTVLIVILFLIAGYWAYKNDTYRPSIKRLLDSPFPWEWFLFAGIYSAAMIHLMTKYSIAGTVRFVLPVTQAAMYLTLLLFLKAKIPWVKGLVILFLSALAIGGISSGLDYRSEALAQSPRTQVWDPGIRQTPEFEKLKIAAAEVDAIAWVNHYPASYYKGSALTNLLYCSKIHYFSKEDLGLIAALPQKTLVATDLPIEDLQKWLGPNVKIHGSFAGFRLHFGFLDPKTVSLPYSGPLKEPNLMSRGCPSHRQ